MTLELWLLLAMTLLAGAMSPGPSVALVLRTAITHGRSSALAVALAHGVGISVYALAVVLGLAALIQNSVFFMNALQIGGALFLLYLGCRMLFGGIRALTEATREGGDGTDQVTSKDNNSVLRLWQHALNGFLIVFFNPKVVIFFVAIFSQFLSTEQLISTQVFAALMAGLIDAAWYALVGILASNQRFAATLLRASPVIDSAFGTLFVSFGIAVILSLF
ncbi:MAG: LysE family translocator [Pseudomonadota bacterium]|nr:LysE family translocator [Pseudomonadota bacterium]MEC8613543.1 LysE family translocator [Pseudomonadota bacterium]